MKTFTSATLSSLFLLLLSSNQVQSSQQVRSRECSACNRVCLPHEVPFGVNNGTGVCDLEEIYYFAGESYGRTNDPDDKRRLLLCKLDMIIDNRYTSRESIVPELLTKLGFEKESDVCEHLEDVSSMGLTVLYKRNFSNQGGVAYHHFMNFAKRAHVDDEFLINLAHESLRSGKMRILKSMNLLLHLEVRLAALNRVQVLKHLLAAHDINALPSNFLELISNSAYQGEHEISTQSLILLRDMGVNLNHQAPGGLDIAQVFRNMGREETARNIEIARSWN